MSFTTEYAKALPKHRNAFITLTFPRGEKKKVIEFCENKETEAASYLLTHEITSESKTHVSVEFEIAYGYGVMLGTYTLGYELGRYLSL